MTLMQQLAKKTRERRPEPRPYTGADKKSANGNRPLTFPTPYHGGKRRWADEILEAFGPERDCVYVEPFSGSAAVLLANPRPYAREILCDTNPHISNVFRCLAWAPETTAFWADWPTTHQDLTARHTWLLRWAVDHVADIEADPDFHDPKAAGWWLWGKSNWIGSEFGVVRGYGASRADTERVKSAPYDPDRLAGMRGLETADDASPPWDVIPHARDGRGVQPQRKTLPGGKPGKPPHHPGHEFPGQRELMPRPAAGGVNAQRTTLPVAPDKRPIAHYSSGVSAQVEGLPTAPDWIPGVSSTTGQGGVNVQSSAPDKRPAVYHQWGGGSGVSTQRDDAGLPSHPDGIRSVPHVNGTPGGRGVQAQRDDAGLPQSAPDIPFVRGDSYGRGVTAQRTTLPGAAPTDRQGAPYPMPYGQHDMRPLTGTTGNGCGVQPQRHTLPDRQGDPYPMPYGQHDMRPLIPGHGGAPGISAQRTTLPGKIPHIAQNGGGIGVTAQREGIADDGPPDATHGARGAIGRARQARQAQAPRPTGPVPLTGDRLRPWFQALAERLYRVIILNRGWQSGLTPTVLQQTRTARKPPVRVLLDPPYKGVGKLYGMSETEADALAIASWRWAAENGSREGWRIAYACREGDFDDEALALGWTCSKQNIAGSHLDSTQEVMWFSPHCLRPGQQRQQAPGEQGRMWTDG